MADDSYDWFKKKINDLMKPIIPIENDGLENSHGDIWSFKKLIMLDFYIPAYVKIMKNQERFNKWIYVDTHCGSGLIDFDDDSDLKDMVFPGSPLIAALHSKKYPFTNYVLSDINSDKIAILKSRLKKLDGIVGEHYNPTVRSFEDTVEFIKKQYTHDTGFLVFLDPFGFKEVTWDLMAQLLKIPTADIFFTYVDYAVSRHQAIARNKTSYEKSLTDFYGNENWKDCPTEESRFELYMRQINKFKRFVFKIPVYNKNKRIIYHVILATNSIGAKSVFIDGQKNMNAIKTETLKAVMKSLAKKQTSMTEFS